jgi:histone-lysine N-methyltransferase SETD3
MCVMLRGSEQVKRRCRWVLSFADRELIQLPGSPEDPFHGRRIDGNTLGGLPRPLLATL